MTSCQTFYCTNEKGKCEKNCFFFIFCNYRSGLPLSTHQPVTMKNMGKYESIGDKKTCVRLKRVKTDRYLTYTANHVKHEIIHRPLPTQINSFVL